MKSSNRPTNLLIKNGHCVVYNKQGQTLVEETDVLVTSGQIAEIGVGLRPHQDTLVIDAKGLHILPGVIDSQVHFREPGLTHKEDLESGTRGAILGGVTAVYEMPNTTPPTTSIQALQDKLSLAAGRSWCDYAFFAGATMNNASQLAQIETMKGCCGVKIFMGSSTGDLLVPDDEALSQILAAGHRRVAVHCEDEQRLRERKHIAEESGDVASHPLWRDELTALKATERVVALARKAQRRVHILHVTTKEEMQFLKSAKDIATVECTPQHLTLAAPECYRKLGTKAQMNPPIRNQEHQLALWQGLTSGVVDVIGSDHAPHTLEEKARPYPQSPSGMTGVQTLLPIMLNHIADGKLSLVKLCELVSTNPARIYGDTRRGRITPGYQGHFTVVDLNKTHRITNDWIASKSQWTPFDGMKVQGWPIMTIIGGRVVMREGEALGQPSGIPVMFADE